MAVKVLLMAVCLALPAAAQAQTAPADGTWRAWAGHDTFRLRDTAKSSPPVDGSPVEWRGAGPILGLAWDRERPFRLHRFDVAFLAAGGFVYDTGIGTIPRPDEEAARFLEGGYEYRRYFARTIGIRSLHALCEFAVSASSERPERRKGRRACQPEPRSQAPSARLRPSGLRRAAFASNHERRLVNRIFASWNHTTAWLRAVDSLRGA